MIIPTAGYVVGSYEIVTFEPSLTSSENSSFSDDTTPIEQSTESHLEIEKSVLSDDDVIELNVGGQRITTLRSTLTAVPNSKLALMFTKDNKSIEESRDKKNTVFFFDYNPVQFNYLLDQLRTIKRTPETPLYEIDFQSPNIDIQAKFSDMIFDLGLNPDQFLSPLAGAHLNLKIDSLIGWHECYRDTYDTPFDILKFIATCSGGRLLVACHPANDKDTLTLAGVSKWQNILGQCSSSNHCNTKITDGTGFYYMVDQAWGFEGRAKDLVSTSNEHNDNNQGVTQSTISLNPCDSSDQYSEYRLCWSLRSDVNRGGGDRCGSVKNLHNAANWERVIYRTV